MALKATIYKAQLQIADMDRHLYADHAVTIARHPSETDERMMVRLLAFALNVAPDDQAGQLEFAKDLWDVDEAALWHRDYTDALQHWIDIGQPDDKRLMRCRPGRAGERLQPCQQHADLVESAGGQDHPGRAHPHLADRGRAEPGPGPPGRAQHATAVHGARWQRLARQWQRHGRDHAGSAQVKAHPCWPRPPAHSEALRDNVLPMSPHPAATPG